MDERDGGLRARLVEAGVELVTREGADALSLREIARRAGVSHGAPRRHFPTHRALLAAIAREGYLDLGRQVAGLLGEGDRDPYDQLLALGRLYLDFARTHRGMFELMFRHDLLRGNHIGLREAGARLFEVLVDLVVRARPEPPDAPSPAVVAGALWANLHGIAQLRLWGSLQMVVGTDDAEPLLRRAVEAHLRR
ncbi:TetR/AcrR family transcriptional regulator [Micromonospora sp. IBHARD004]|uniref:TetR/AcrR family transcriptional regulator n=1 Tax=Micromonospora sp. IBHARD004 TaxID=3457764 RepID=UPI0040589337